MADALSRLKAYQQTDRLLNDSPNFQQAKARALAILNPTQALHQAHKSPQALYQKLVALNRMNRVQDAMALLRKDSADKDSKSTQLAYAQALLSANRLTSAIKMLKTLAALYPDSESVHYYLATAQARAGQGEEGLLGLKSILNKKRHDPDIDLLASKISAEIDKTAISHEYLADYYASNGQLEDALKQLDIVERAASKNDKAILARSQAKRDEIEKLIAALRKL